MTTGEMPGSPAETTTARQSRPAGWYDDPEDPGRMRRWDGVGWTDSWMPRASATAGVTATRREGWAPDPVDRTRLRWWTGSAWGTRVVNGPIYAGQAPVGRGFWVLQWVLVALLALDVAVGVARLAVQGWALGVVDRWATDGGPSTQAEIEHFDSLRGLVGLLAGAGLVVTGLVFVTWLFQALGSDRVDSGRVSHGRGWAIGGWFVPVLSLVRPYEMVRDLTRGLSARAPSVRFAPLVALWWAGFLVLSVAGTVSRFAGRGIDTAVELDEVFSALRTIVLADLTSAAGSVLAGALAAVLVIRIGSAMRGTEHDEPLPPAPPAA